MIKENRLKGETKERGRERERECMGSKKKGDKHSKFLRVELGTTPKFD